MRALIQRAIDAKVTINGTIHGQIEKGLVIFLGVEHADTIEDIKWLIQKIYGLRIFSDDNGKMNVNSEEANGSFLVISQFTLHASTKKGNRPSYIKAAKPEVAIPLYENFLALLKTTSNANVEQGVFGADMKVNLTNDGPVTIWLDSKNRE